MGNQKSQQRQFIFYKKEDIISLNLEQFKLQGQRITSLKKSYKILENHASLFFNYGDILKYSIFIYQNEFKIEPYESQIRKRLSQQQNSTISQTQEQELTEFHRKKEEKNENVEKYKYMLLTPFIPYEILKDYLENEGISQENFVKQPFFMLLFFNDLKEVQKNQIKGFQYQQELKGNVVLDLNTQKLVFNLQKIMGFDYDTNFDMYFQLNEKQIDMIKTINQNSSNFLFSLIACYLIQASLFTLHRIDTGSEVFIKKGEEIKRIIEFDFSELLEGKCIKNTYFWKKIKGIQHENIMFELQKHKLATKRVIGGISTFIRKINPYSPQHKKFRIIMYTLKEDNTQYSQQQDKKPQQQQIEQKDIEYLNLQELYNSNSLEDLELKMYNIERDDEQRMQFSSIYKTKLFQSMPVFSSQQ